MEKEKISKIIDSVNNAVHNDEQIKKVVDSVDKVTQNLKDQTVPKWRRILSVVLTVGAVVYDVCPIDLVPAFPLDNLLATGAATFNLIQQNAQNQQALIVKMSKYLKWTFVLLLIMAVLIFGTLVALIINLVGA